MKYRNATLHHATTTILTTTLPPPTSKTHCSNSNSSSNNSSSNNSSSNNSSGNSGSSSGGTEGMRSDSSTAGSHQKGVSCCDLPPRFTCSIRNSASDLSLASPPLTAEEIVIFEQRKLLNTTPLLKPPANIALIGLIAVTWLALTPLQLIFCGLLSATVFACMEMFFRGVTGVLEHHIDEKSMFFNDKEERKIPLLYYFITYAWTTWEQWSLCLFSAPFAYHYAMLFDHKVHSVFFFPLFIYFLEIVCGYFLIYFWKRRAWFYEGKLAMFHGNITLIYLPVWWIMGVIHVALSSYLYVPASCWMMHMLGLSQSVVIDQY